MTHYAFFVLLSVCWKQSYAAASYGVDTSVGYNNRWHFGGGSLAVSDQGASFQLNASASYGVLGTGISFDITDTAVSSASIDAFAYFSDHIVIDGGILNGTVGLATYSFALDGHGELNYDPTSPGQVFDPFTTGSFITLSSSAGAGSRSDRRLNTWYEVDADTLAYDSGVISISHEFTFGTPFDIDVYFGTRFSGGWTIGYPISGNFDFLHTASLNNVTISDVTGTPIPVFTLGSDSGFDYGVPNQSVPDDASTITLLVSAISVLTYLRRRQNA
jgi:hypothetical protein